MVSLNRILITLTTFFAMSSYASAFWFSSEEPKTSSPRFLYQQPDYYRQYAPPPPLPYVPVPMQVPLPAQLAPATVQNVQLVPCLCPVGQDYSYENDYVSSRKASYGQQQVVNQQQRRR